MFKLQIKTGNDAFGEVPGIEVAGLLFEVGKVLESDPVGPQEGLLRDVNGSTVGYWRLDSE
jgi:hypothetical protein